MKPALPRWRGVVLAILLLAGCAPKASPDRLTLEPVRFGDLRGWQADDLSAALSAFARSCAVLTKKSDETQLGIAGRVADWRAPCAEAAALDHPGDATARHFFETWFSPWRAANNGRTEGLFTGYYEAELRGARQRSGAYATPLLRRPGDLVMVELGLFRPSLRGERIAGRVVDGRLKPYESRAEIDEGALAHQHLAFLWVDDPVDAFFLHIQGSGRVRLSDGTTLRVGYDGQNGWPYVPVGRLLIERGALTKDEVSMQSIRAWIRAHPEEGKALMDQNPSYVFFREVGGDGPLGSEGVVLTASRSLAVDRDFVPLGVPLWLDAGDDLRRLVIAQDTGGAIRGPVRGDLFWGHGGDAEARAGTMKARGGYYLLLPKTVGPSQIGS